MNTELPQTDLPQEVVRKAHLQDILSTSESMSLFIIGQLALRQCITKNMLYGDGEQVLYQMFTDIRDAIEESGKYLGQEQLLRLLTGK